MGFPFSLRDTDIVESKPSSLEPFSTTKSHVLDVGKISMDTPPAQVDVSILQRKNRS